MKNTQTKKTIFLTIIRGMMARNLLHNDFYKILREKFRIVILTPAANDERFCKEFSHPNVEFIYFEEKRHGRADTIFLGLNKYLIYSKYIGLKLRYGIRGLTKPEDLSLIRYYFFTVLFKPLSKIKFLRDIVKWIDYLFAQREEVKEFRELIKKEKPVLVVVTSIMSNIEAALLKAARKENITTIGMPKSWDNPSRAGWRAKAETLVVWSEFMAEQAIEFQNYKRHEIKIVGIPQFDDYRNESKIWSREKFAREFGLSPERKVILFGSDGKGVPEDKVYASLVERFISEGAFSSPSQLLIRPHYIYKDDEKKFSHLVDKPNVAVDLSNDSSTGFKDRADYSPYHQERFINCLYHCDLVITVASTVALDGIAFDKPVINIAFDVPLEGEDFSRHPIALGYESDYYQEIVHIGATKLARSEDDLKILIERYLKNPRLEGPEREELRNRLCYKIDGLAGRRFADIVLGAAGE